MKLNDLFSNSLYIFLVLCQENIFSIVNGFHMMLITCDFSDGKYMSVISQEGSE